MAQTELSLARQDTPYDDSYQYWCGADVEDLIYACENEDQYLSPGEIIHALEDGKLEQAADYIIMRFAGQEQVIDVSIDWRPAFCNDSHNEPVDNICRRIAKCCHYTGDPMQFIDDLDRVCQAAGHMFTLQHFDTMAQTGRIEVSDGYAAVFDIDGHIIADGFLED